MTRPGKSSKTSVLIAATAILAVTFTLAPSQVHAQIASETQSLVNDPVYKKDCAKCHGGNATGRHFGGPALNSDKARAMSADETAQIIGAGHGRMPAFAKKLTPEQITALAAEIKAFQQSAQGK